MGAPAVSPSRPAPRTRPKAKPARRRRPSSSTSSGNVVMLPVNAVGRTAVAFGGIADSGVVVGMARSRLWIGVLGVLLGGIVAINVVGLSLSASGSQTSAKIDDLVRDNSVQQSRLAHRLANGRISREAGAMGLAIPAPDAVHYLKAADSDAKQAAKRLADGSIANAPPATAPSEGEPAVDPATTTDPAADPATATVATDPATAPVTTDPAVAPVTTP
jgi:hypothetical protein